LGGHDRLRSGSFLAKRGDQHHNQNNDQNDRPDYHDNQGSVVIVDSTSR
jgi:hypothetical protein